MRTLAFAFAAVLALASAGAHAAAPAPNETEPPGLTSGQLANRTFVVHAPEGSGVALYFGNGSLEGDASATHAVIVVHGVLRNADEYFATGQLMLAKARAAHTLLVAPQFVEESDLQGHNVPKRTLYWSGEWPGGSAAIAPAPVSSYAVFDAMLVRLSDRKRFPKMREVTIIGHSAGGQIVQRYAVVGRGPSLLANSRVKVHLIVANPSSYLYLTNDRPFPNPNCSDFAQWRYGLAGAPPYVQGTSAQLEARYVTRDVTYLLGTGDTNAREWDLDKSCGGETQGAYRFERGKLYIAYLKRRHPGGTAQTYAFVRGVPHDNRRMFTSQCGIGVVFNRSLATCAASGKV